MRFFFSVLSAALFAAGCSGFGQTPEERQAQERLTIREWARGQ